MGIKCKLLAVTVVFTILTAFITGCSGDKGETSKKKDSEPKEIVESILYDTKNKNYDGVEDYSRSFSTVYLKKYFEEQDEALSEGQLEKYKLLLEEMFKAVSYENLLETVEEGGRTATVTGTFTTIDLKKFTEKTDLGITEEMKMDFDKEMDYLMGVVADQSLKSNKYTVSFDFKKSEDGWYLSDKNQLILLTLGYYTKTS